MIDTKQLYLDTEKLEEVERHVNSLGKSVFERQREHALEMFLERWPLLHTNVICGEKFCTYLAGYLDHVEMTKRLMEARGSETKKQLVGVDV